MKCLVMMVTLTYSLFAQGLLPQLQQEIQKIAEDTSSGIVQVHCTRNIDSPAHKIIKKWRTVTKEKGKDQASKRKYIYYQL